MDDLYRRWKLSATAFLAAMGIVAVIIKDYPAIVLLLSLLSSNIAFLINPKESKAKKLAQVALLSVAIGGGCIYFYTRIKTARQ